MAEIWDTSSILNILQEITDSGAIIHGSFPLGRNTRKADLVFPEKSGLLLVDNNRKWAYQVGMPQKAFITRFTSHPLHNFLRIYYKGAAETDKPENNAEVGDKAGELNLRIRSVNKPGWLVLFPLGSLFSDQRLEVRVRELALKGRESSLMSEFLAIDEGRMQQNSKIELIDYVPEDARLWEKWFDKMDTNMFQTIVRPSNFSSNSGRDADYYLKMILCNNKKVGTVWLEKINQRNGTAELGLLIGEPQLWGMGLGSKAMKAMIEIAKEDLAIKFLWVSVREANQRAVNCYKKNGFTITRKVPVFYNFDGSYKIWLHMEKMI
ncbi:MAG: GNAT family N-acetyltransferase [Peptococcaceae bacterium]|nr:GNAT family N-acetyltransferase [Peptococcaceae bacterium]